LRSDTSWRLTFVTVIGRPRGVSEGSSSTLSVSAPATTGGIRRPSRSRAGRPVQGGPSIVDLPAAGCWTFRLLWVSGGAPHSSVINLDVLPAGTAP